MFRHLYTRLALAMGLLFILIGGVLIWITGSTSELYSLETTQRVNRDIALHAAEDMPLLSAGEVNEPALKELAHHVMFINPIVEVYLLDTQGRILSHALPYGSVLRERVEMAPLKAFLADERALPIFGDDPRSLDGEKTFSVSPVLNEDGETAAYLYTVLNGKTFDGIQRSLAESYHLRSGVFTMVAALLAALLAGYVLFFVLTRRLHRLSNAVQRYRMDDFRGELPITTRPGGSDEIDELTAAIQAMSTRIEQQFDAQREIDRNRRELIANVSHDLRTPVSTIQGYLETVLVKDLPAAEQQDYLETAHRQCTRLNELISELFELSTLESGTVEPHWERFPVMELVQDILHDYERLAEDRGITLSGAASANGIEVFADIAMIHRVLGNLINNALRHTRRGGEITILVAADDDRVRVEVVDNGEGIASKDIPHIFERFYRPDTESPSTGHGLGLAIVKRIVELHQSHIAVHSERDSGTQFQFWLPRPA